MFWPFADDDLADAIIWDQGSAFWAYGYADIHAAVFAPYGASELVSYASRRRTRIPPLDRFCGSDERDGAGLPVERMTQAVQPNEAQRAALDEFATAWRSASQIVRIHCQQQPATSGLERLAVMQNRIEAMIEATAVIAPQLVKLDQLLDPDQKQRLAALAGGTQATPVASRPRQVATAACQAAPPASPRDERKAQEFLARQWPVAQISASLHLGDVQSAALEVVQGTATRFLDPLEAACPLQPPATMPARLEAVQARLKAMLQSIKDVSAALDDFNYNLTDEQKAQFEAWGPKRGT